MLQDPSQFAKYIDDMLSQSMGIADAAVEEEEETESVPEVENAEEEVDQEDEDEDKSSKDELWMNATRDWMFFLKVCLIDERCKSIDGRLWKYCSSVNGNYTSSLLMSYVMFSLQNVEGWK